MCELLVGLPEVNVLGIDDVVGEPLRVHIEVRTGRPGCAGCGVFAHVKDRPVVELVDLPCFGRPSRLVWHKHRWQCPESSCPMRSWIGKELRIGAPRMAMSDRAGRWVTEQVGRYARSVNEIATELGCDWHTINFTVMLPDAVQVADPFHVVKLANTKLDECRRRVQNETMGHRGHKADPLYRCRRLLTKATERLDDKGREKLMGLLRAGDPKGDVATMWK